MAGEHNTMFIPLGELVFDYPDYSAGGTASVAGYFPYAQGFISTRNPTSEDAGLTALNFTQSTPSGGSKVHHANCLHAHPTQVIVSDGGVDSIYPNVSDLFIGGVNDIALREDFLGQLATPSTTNVTNGGLGAYGMGASDPRPWSMASWSWDSVVATNYSDVPQVYYYGGSGTFEDMITRGATTMRAMHVAVLGRHIVLANINFEEDPLPTPNGTNANCLTYFGDATDLYHPDIVWWSGTDDETTFSDENTHPGENTSWQPLWDTPGSITAICPVGDRALAIFKNSSIYLMELTGSDELFHFSVVSSNVGTIWPNSVVAVNRDIYFISSQGRVCVLRNGSAVEYVGTGKVNSFFGTFYGGEWHAGQMRHFTQAAYSAPMNSVFFQYKHHADHGLYFVKYLVYSLESDSFGVVDGTEETVQSAFDDFPADHPICSYLYDEEFYPIDGTLEEASYPGIVMYDPYAAWTSTPSRVYTGHLWFLGSDSVYAATGLTKKFSFGEQTVVSPPAATIYAVRPVATGEILSINVKSYYGPIGTTLIATKSTGPAKTANGWWTVSGGSTSGQFFAIEWAATTSHHVLGFEVEYSLSGKRS